MEAERQTHVLATDGKGRSRIARAMGFTATDAIDATARFDAELERRRGAVRRAFDDFFVEAGTDRVFSLLARHAPHLLAIDPTRAMLQELCQAFARAIEASSDPERALDNLGEFVRGVGKRRFYFELLIDRPELVARLTQLFAGSKYLSAILAQHPRLIEPLFADPNVLLLSREALRADLAEIESEQRARDDDDEALLAALRLFRHRQVLNVGLLDVGDKIERRDAARGLTDVAETCIVRALDDGLAWLARKRPEASALLARTRFCVVGMGTLASREMTYGSDLDLVFVYDAEPDDRAYTAELQDLYARVAQRVISLLSTLTAQGRCYEVDTRLRPSGSQGSLVSSFEGFVRYHAGEAALWERQALLRARAVAGDSHLAEAFERHRLEVLARPLPEDAATQVAAVRRRMELELAQETASRRHVKLGRGGALDVEAVVQLLQLVHGRAHPELFAPEPVERHLAYLGRHGLLSPERAAALVEGWEFLQRLASRLRLVDDRSMSDLDTERGDLDGLARRLGFPPGEREGGARRALLTAYEQHSERIRAVYREVIGTS
jgi:glutamate-ammonia-ligase adenylyltransferase